MATIILHHYRTSPYAEKVRVILGYKGAAWRSVEVPIMPPRPSLTPVLGDLRRIPVLQVGADFFCDTRLIAQVLDALYPDRRLDPPGSEALSELLAGWVEPRVFVMMGPVRFHRGRVSGDAFATKAERNAFGADRAAFMRPAVETARFMEIEPSARDQVRRYLVALAGLLRSGGDYLTGDRPAQADFSAYHTMWWLRQSPNLSELLEVAPALSAWADRMAAFGHGRSSPMSPDEALEAARSSQSSAPWRGGWPQRRDDRVGAHVRIAPDDYGRDALEGELVEVSDRHAVVRRAVPSIGTVWVHVPLIGHEIVGAAPAQTAAAGS